MVAEDQRQWCAQPVFCENMRQVAPGDIVVSFCDTRIKAVGIVTDVAQTAPKPDFGNVGLDWSKEGWFVPIYYCGFESPLRPKDYMAILRHFLPAGSSPLQATGDGLQSVYLAEPPGPMADALIGLIGQPYQEALAELMAFPSGPDVDGIGDPEVDSDFGPTFKEQLVKARRGQGVFRSSVLLSKTECRVTSVSEAKHLRASHIKPRSGETRTIPRGSTVQMVSLPSPHIDHLFDQGYISFSNHEELLVVPGVRASLLDKWGIDAGTRVGEFNREQPGLSRLPPGECLQGVKVP